MTAVKLVVLLGVVFASCMYGAVRVVVTYDRQKGLGEVAMRRGVYFSIAVGLAVGLVTFFAAR